MLLLNMKIRLRDMVLLMTRQENSVATEVLQVLASRKRMRDKSMADFTFSTALKIRLGVEFGDRSVVCNKRNHTLQKHEQNCTSVY